jgi:hypothetical protein
LCGTECGLNALGWDYGLGIAAEIKGKFVIAAGSPAFGNSQLFINFEE